MIKIISGNVISGNKIGRQIGFRTANLPFLDDNFSEGTYKINIFIEGKLYHGVGAYVKSKGVFESHIFDFSDDIYGKNIDVYVLEKIRDNRKFESLDDLKLQISKDVDYAKTRQIKVMTFGTFDIFHEGHKYYLNESQKYGDKLITIVARDKNVENLKNYLTQNKERKRVEIVTMSGISDIVELGELDDHLLVIDKYNPDIICLGYDQNGFIDKLKESTKYKNIKIIRLKAFYPDKYKSSLLKNT